MLNGAITYIAALSVGGAEAGASALDCLRPSASTIASTQRGSRNGCRFATHSAVLARAGGRLHLPG